MLRSAVLLLLCACATSQVMVPPDQRAAVKRELEGQDRYLKLSFNATPFFGDATKRLLTAVSPAQVRLLDNPREEPINPGAVETIFPAGTQVRITSVDFPTALSQTERVLMTPRTQVWVFVDVAGTPKDAPPYVLVLRQQIKDDRELNTEVDRWLTREDPRARIASFGEPIVAAIAAKKPVLEMGPEALEMACGYPEKRVLAFDGDKKKETWVWPDGKQVVLTDGRVTELWAP